MPGRGLLVALAAFSGLSCAGLVADARADSRALIEAPRPATAPDCRQIPVDRLTPCADPAAAAAQVQGVRVRLADAALMMAQAAPKVLVNCRLTTPDQLDQCGATGPDAPQLAQSRRGRSGSGDADDIATGSIATGSLVPMPAVTCLTLIPHPLLGCADGAAK